MFVTVILVTASVLLLVSVVLAVVAPDRAWLRLLLLVFGLGPWLLCIWALWSVVAHRAVHGVNDSAWEELQAMDTFSAYLEGANSMYHILSGGYHMLFTVIGILVILHGVELFRLRSMRRKIDALKRAAGED